jgi:rubrerythrin
MTNQKNTVRKSEVSKQQNKVRTEAYNSARRDGIITTSDFSKLLQTDEKKMTEQTETEQSDKENHITCTCKNCGYDRCKTKDNYCTCCGIKLK